MHRRLAPSPDALVQILVQLGKILQKQLLLRRQKPQVVAAHGSESVCQPVKRQEMELVLVRLQITEQVGASGS